ncbi:uncharacterized protein CTRU02_201593 [Colletotrichum truncatum]|uniref:Uncharacterized protein n=1 Tax=Colletotrichum truncatum TaxID=5467 RepID=A0ACC3ZHU5_COLTU|nr:uncharacterized protein CTRU02_10821 [Colletotrichum truncatum]KAF6786697.1 hypothetical protein CTRU02_10821 [Colletotrichum truncatum]
MSGDQPSAQLEAAESIPIAQLNPEVQELKSRVVRGVVTITWPYSIINKTVAFLLAEPDFRLRRAKGQVRVEFSGSSAKAVRDAALGSGDEIVLSLDGVELAANDSKTRVPGTSLEWQLKFTERILLQAKISDSEEVKRIDIDHPTVSESEPVPEQLPESVLDSFNEPAKSPEPFATPVKSASSKRPADQSLGLDEYASPAFLKRARVSYGSLFEGSLNIFDEDVSVKTRAKKRAKTGRYSGVWRYASRSPSPEPQIREDEEIDDASMADEQPATATPSRPKMVDEASQTVELDTSPPRDVQVAAEARHNPAQGWHTPSKSSMIDSGVQSDLPGVTHTPKLDVTSNLNRVEQPMPMPIFTSAHEHYPPAFDQPPLGPVFDHDIHQTGMEPQYHADGSFHEHSEAYPEAGLEHGVEAHGQYPASFLESPHFEHHTVAPSQPIHESMPAYQDHDSQGHIVESGHHATFIDQIAEPQQVPWGHASTQPSRSSVMAGEGAPPDYNSAPAGREGEFPMKEQPGTQAVPTDHWAEDRERRTRDHHEDPEGQQAAMRVEEDQVSEDHDGPEEEYTSRTYAERHFEPKEEKEEEEEEEEGEEEEAAASAIDQASSESSESSSEDSDADAEPEEDDAGGDYDITNYRNLSNIQDDDDGSDLESDYGEEDEEEMLDPDVQGNEDDELDEDAENYGEYDEYEEEEDYDEAEDQENQPPAVSSGAPQVISLLSDSEDEEDEVPPPVPEVPTRRVPQYDGSADEMDEDDLEDEEDSDKENALDNKDQQVSSPVIHEEESGDDESDDATDHGTPTPKPRENISIPNSTRSVHTSSPKDTVGFSADMTTTTIGDDLETMSPVRLPHVIQPSNDDSSRPASRDDSEMLEAELQQELEQEIAADDVHEDQKTPDRQDIEAAPTSAATEATNAPEADSQEAMDTAESDVKVEIDVRTEEVRTAPQETSAAEVDPEPAEGFVAEPMDVNMADTDENPVDEAAGEQHEESEMDTAEAPEPVLEDMDEEQLIQSQLADETMAEEEHTLIVETSETVEYRENSPTESNGPEYKNASPNIETMESLKVEVKSSAIDSLATPAQDGKGMLPREPVDAMDVDEPDAKQVEVASPPPTQMQSQSFEEVRLVETHVSQVAEEPGTEDNTRLTHLPTPAETQVTESFMSYSAVETQVTEEVSTGVAPSVPAESSPKKETPSATGEKLENPGNPTSPINDESSQIRDSSAQPSEAQSSLIAEEVAEETNAAQSTPRRARGHRRNKSDSKDVDPSVKLARASIASRRSTRLSDRTTPDSTRVTTRARSHSLALKSDSPDEDEDAGVQLARAAIKSPSRGTREADEGDVAAAAAATAPAPAPAGDATASLKAQLAKSLRNAPDCISLKVLRNHPGRAVDVIAIATTEPPEAKRAKGGPRGIMLAFNITDHSIAPTQTVPVQIFRPHKAALPVVHPGDAILLRQFTITSITGRGFGLRANDGSSWAVFERDSEDDLPQIRGPPVELTEGETSHAALLKQWYTGLDAKALAKLDKANEAAPAVEAGKEDTK